MISVITVTYNNPEELTATLTSVPPSDYIENIIINGGKEEYSVDILAGRKGKVINESDSGIADAFNKGVQHASGNAVMFLNSGDVLLEPEYILRSDKLLSENSSTDFIHSNLLFADSLGENLLMKPRMKNIGRGMPYLHPTMIVRKEIFEELGGFNTGYKISMDYDHVVRMEKNKKKGVYIDGPAVVKMDGTGKSAAQESAAIKECFRSLKQNKYITASTLFGFVVRLKLYAFRMVLVKTGSGALLKLLKRKKYNN